MHMILYSREEMVDAMLFAFDTFSDSLSRSEVEDRINEYINRLEADDISEWDDSHELNNLLNSMVDEVFPEFTSVRPDNRTLILQEFDQHKGEFIIMGNSVTRLIAVGTDDEDYYWVTYNGRETTWHSCVGGFTPLKNKIDDRYYEELIRLSKLNHYDQIDPDHKSFIEKYSSNEIDILLTDICWDLN